MILNEGYIKFEANKVTLNKSVLGRMYNTILNSSILPNDKEISKLMSLSEFSINKKWNLIYKGSKNGFKSSDFHSKCDDKPNTLVIIKSKNGNVFGGYTEKSWSNIDSMSSMYEHIDKLDSSAFIFSLINKENRSLKKNVHHIMVYVATIVLVQYLEELKGKVIW